MLHAHGPLPDGRMVESQRATTRVRVAGYFAQKLADQLDGAFGLSRDELLSTLAERFPPQVAREFLASAAFIDGGVTLSGNLATIPLSAVLQILGSEGQNGELSLYFHMIGSEGFEVVKVGTKIHDLAAADMNGDGREDIVALVDGPSGHSEVAVVLLVPSEQDTGMSFVTSYYPVHCDASVLAVGDLDADGRLDVVTVSSGSLSNLATILRGDGLGLFSGVMSVQLGGPVDDLKLADLNSDGGVELLTISRDAGAYGVILSSP